MRCIPAPLALTPTLSQRERGQNRQHCRSAQKRSSSIPSRKVAECGSDISEITKKGCNTKVTTLFN